jgi:hypothetical protein
MRRAGRAVAVDVVFLGARLLRAVSLLVSVLMLLLAIRKLYDAILTV